MNKFIKLSDNDYKCIVTGNKINCEFYFSSIDYDRIKEHSWYIGTPSNSKTLYVFAKINKRKYPLHKFILNVEIETGERSSIEIDHIDRNGLNNRRENLKIVSAYENNKNQGKRNDNTSGFTGVTKRKNCYIAEIRDSIHGRKSKSFCIKKFKNEEEALKAAVQQRKIWSDEYNNKNGN